MFILKYTKAQYEGKIAELEGYLSQLNDCYETMSNLKEQMFTFWNDDQAQEASQLLISTMRQVRNATVRTEDMINIYKKTISEMGGADSAISDLQSEAASALSALGI